MTDTPLALSSPFAPRATRARRIAIVGVALVAGSSAVVLANAYQRPAPRGAAAPTTMTVGAASVTLAPTASQWSVIEVGTAGPGEPHWSDPISARVLIDDARTSRLGAPLAGRVTSIAVERGARVRAGDPLFTVASSSLAELRSEQAKARVERDSARIALDRTQALVDGQALPGKELVAAKQQMTEGELAVRLSDQKLAALHVTATGDSSFTVTAPRDGVVVEKSLAIGQGVDASTGSLLAIADLSVVWVVADVFEANLGSLAAGGRARIVTEGGEIDAVVDQVSALVDPDRHTIPVRVKIDNREGKLRPNAHVQLRFLDASPAPVELPASAVLSDGAASYVYLRDGAALLRHAVTVGSAHAGKVAVLAGLSPGDTVVTRGAILLDNQIQLDH